jgi:hypothetical protein
MEDDKVIEVMKKYLIDFVEKPHPAFGNLPICPFAKKARIENKLLYKVMKLDVFDALMQTLKWHENPGDTQALIMVHPTKDISWEEYSHESKRFQDCLDVADVGLSLFVSHPESDYMEHGIYTRREPYPNWQIMRAADLEKAQGQLKKSNWHNTVA